MMRLRFVILLATAVGLAALVAPLAAKSGDAPSTHGPYEVIFKGEYDGTGWALVVTSKVVYIKGNVTDTKHGKKGWFHVKNMPLSDDGHFSGGGHFTDSTGARTPVSLEGRVEVPASDNVIRRARIICTFTTADGDTGRVIGSR